MGKPLPHRFWSKSKRSSTRTYNGVPCWEWQGALNFKGYGHFKINGATMRTNRVAWILAFGEIADGLQVCHHCDNPRCINPQHLFLGTNQDNVDDREHKRRARTKGK